MKMKKNKGITLIALIITIIVLLILAGVTIAMLTGENGILSKAQTAAEKTKRAEAEEQVRLAILASYDNIGKIDKEKLIENLNKIKGIEQITEIPESNKVIVNGYEIDLEEILNNIDKTEPSKPQDVPVTGITLDKTELVIGTGNTDILTATIEPENATNKDITWTSSDEQIATVDNGTITAIKSGTVTITATAGDKSTTCSVITGNRPEIGKIYNDTTELIDKNGKTFYIPGGFKIHSDTTDDVNTGIVITDGTSEFVWIPVDNITSMAKTTSGTDANGNINYQGKLYDFSASGYTEMTNYGQGTESYREPSILEDTTDGDKSEAERRGYDLLKNIVGLTGTNEEIIAKWSKQLQEEYNKMVKSVGTYKGFYVGRYETSLDTNKKAQSKKGETSATASKSNANTWYGLYQKQKEYKVGKAQGSMIWGSQWDQMMIWMKKQGITVESGTTMTGTQRNETRVTGAEGSKDLLNNIYDIYGNSFEWTLESNDTNVRVRRGGLYNVSNSPNARSGSTRPYAANIYHGSRLSLYIE